MYGRERGNPYWLPDDPHLNETEAWPAELFPEAQYRFIRDAGCLLCSLAAMFSHMNPEAREPVDPWEPNRRLISDGAFTPAADLRIDAAGRLYSLVYQAPEAYSREGLVRIAGQCFPCLVTVPGIHAARHFLTPLRLLPEDAEMFDPCTGVRMLSEYPVIYEIRWFRPEPGT